MTINYTGANIDRKGNLNVSAGSEDYTVNVDKQVKVYIKASTSGDGVINLGSTNDNVSNSGSGDLIVNLGAGNDTFIQVTNSNAIHLNITGGPGDDTLYNIGGPAKGGATANFNYSFAGNVVSTDGHDLINGFQLARDTLTFDVPSTVTKDNLGQFFTVVDGSSGTVVFENSSPDFSISLVGVHNTDLAHLANSIILV